SSGTRSFWINYLGPPGAFPQLSLYRLATVKPTELRRVLEGAVVLIGETYEGTNDIHRGPGGAQYSGVEINAHALATLLDWRPLRRAWRSWEALLTLALGTVLTIVAASLPFGWGLGLVVAAAGAWWMLGVRAFAHDRLWPIAGPLLAM